MKRRLAQWRWRIAGLTVVLAVARIAVAVGFELFGPAEGAANNALSAVAAAWDALCLGLVVVAVVAFVQYSRIFNARVPTE